MDKDTSKKDKEWPQRLAAGIESTYRLVLGRSEVRLNLFTFRGYGRNVRTPWGPRTVEITGKPLRGDLTVTSVLLPARIQLSWNRKRYHIPGYIYQVGDVWQFQGNTSYVQLLPRGLLV